MASWNEMRGHIASKYKVTEDKGDLLVMVFDTGDGRSQVVLVGLGKNTSTGEEWVNISSAIGTVQEVNLLDAATLAFGYLCGGIVVIGDLVYLHHAAPLANLDVNEFERPLSIILDGADTLEDKLVGGDKF